MDPRKVDPALAAALKELSGAAEALLTVFIHSDEAPAEEKDRVLKQWGVKEPSEGRKVQVATLSPRAVAALTEQPWIRYIRLSQRLRPLDPHE